MIDVMNVPKDTFRIKLSFFLTVLWLQLQDGVFDWENMTDQELNPQNRISLSEELSVMVATAAPKSAMTLL